MKDESVVKCSSKAEYEAHVMEKVGEFTDHLRAADELRGVVAVSCEGKSDFRVLMVGNPAVLDDIRMAVAKYFKLHTRKRVSLPLGGIVLFTSLGVLIGLTIAP